MSRFEKGDTVILVSSKEKGYVTVVHPIKRGKQYYKVVVNGIEYDILETQLLQDLNITDPFEKLSRNIYNNSEEFSVSNTVFKIKNGNANNISTLLSSKTIFKPYQYKPLLKFLQSSNHRILVADEVGLGKTIEAGHILSELRARKDLRYALIVCPKSLQSKWQDELIDKFGLSFKIFESTKDFIESLKTQHTVLGILNYEKLRGSKNNGLNSCQAIVKTLESTHKRFDFITCDEAHRLRNHASLVHIGIREIMHYADAALFLTATPIMIKQENLYYLLNLLDEQEYGNLQVFENALRVNAPFIRAISMLNTSQNSFNEIVSKLKDEEVTTYTEIGDYLYPEAATIEERFKDVPLFKHIVSKMENSADDIPTRVELQRDLSSLSKMNNIFSRTRKRDVTQDWSQATRRPQTLMIRLHKEEREDFDQIINDFVEENTYVDWYGEDRMPRGKAFSLVNIKRQVSSSVNAYLSESSDLEKGIDVYSNRPDAKFDQLLKIIDEIVVKHRKKLIVFAVFHKTLDYLKIRLASQGFESILIYGSTSNRYQLIEDFKESESANVLLSSEVGSEGLDMQFCDAIVNYDLPWNPMVVEQRIGRIDRFGQQSPVVNIYNFVVEDSIQEQIYTRLLDRIGIFRDSIGDLEAILDKELESVRGQTMPLRDYFSSLENELYSVKLTKDEQNERIDFIAKAVLTEQANAKEISESLTNALTNDASFQNEIDRILKHKQYVTENEIKLLLQYLIREKLPTLILDIDGQAKDIYKIQYDKSLISFLNAYRGNNPEIASLIDNFRNRLRDDDELKITFKQESAFNNKRIDYVNVFHPLVLAALEWLTKEADLESQNTFKSSLHTDLLPAGDYCLAVYEIGMRYNKYGVTQTQNRLAPVIYDIRAGEIIEDRELSETILSELQQNASLSISSHTMTTDDVNDLRIALLDAANEITDALFDEESVKVDSTKILEAKRQAEYFDQRIKRWKQLIDEREYLANSPVDSDESKNARQILPATRKQLEKENDDKEKALAKINGTSVQKLPPHLISLTIVKV